jgi:hypothetical protein
LIGFRRPHPGLSRAPFAAPQQSNLKLRRGWATFGMIFAWFENRVGCCSGGQR